MIIVPGPVLIFAGAAKCRSYGEAVDLSEMAMLGQTENGVQVSISNRAHRVNVDDMGGSQGAPAELIYLGSSASIRGVLVDYGEANSQSVSENVKKMLWGIARGWAHTSHEGDLNNDGEIPIPGTPLFEYGGGFSLYLSGNGMSYYFPRCEFATSPREWNVSSLERKTSFTANAYEIPLSDTANPSASSPIGRCLYFVDPATTGAPNADHYQSCRTSTHSDVTA